ncbi:hypothetical protein [Methylomonas albis]|uniref:Uncharacterized protein n=1 Tax=Methylomonas albis TaxID=1854563 RepID=A0ABR9CVH9_9GAMM|nr:hypothetical protein [Methylomonas albis]MBD9354860.1 hypothetical protein [Methylomonas albis]
MLQIKFKKMRGMVCLFVLSSLLTPTLTQADSTIVLAAAETGSVAARQAADQKAALAKKAAERAAKKAAETPTPADTKTPSETAAPVTEQKDK